MNGSENHTCYFYIAWNWPFTSAFPHRLEGDHCLAILFTLFLAISVYIYTWTGREGTTWWLPQALLPASNIHISVSEHVASATWTTAMHWHTRPHTLPETLNNISTFQAARSRGFQDESRSPGVEQSMSPGGGGYNCRQLRRISVVI